MVKYFRFSMNQILWQISWVTVQMLCNTIETPDYDTPGKDGKEADGDIGDFLSSLN